MLKRLTIRRPQAVRLCLWLGAAVLAMPAAARAQDGSTRSEPSGRAGNAHDAAPIVYAARLDGGIDLDGRLEEDGWRGAPAVTEFLQTEPFDGRPSTERTEVHVLFDEEALYIGARMYESTGRVAKRLGRRDSFLSDSDWFYVMLDSYHGHQTAYQFSVNPSGVKRDEVTSGSGGDSSWDAVWDVATSIDEHGWTAELRIPFSQLRFSASAVQTWGIQFSRRIISKEEVVVLAHTPKSERGGVARYGHLRGLEGLRPGKKIEALPYLVSRAEYVDVAPANPFRDGSDYFYGAGLDLKYRVTSALTLDATINPDFGQVEVDPAVVNLSAFETSFDEKRPFFVEGNDIFRVNEMRLFYSRRIGRSPQGGTPDGTLFSNRPDAATILGAAKLTGRTASGWRVGVLEAVTAREDADFLDGRGEFGRAVVEPQTNYFVGRAEKNLRSGQSSIGAIVTAVNRDLGTGALDNLLRSSAYAGGLDFSHEFAQRAWSISGYFAASRIAGSSDALLRAQHASSRYFQRPDADYVELDSARTSLEGYTARLDIRKIAGLHWRGEANIAAISPGFEINDLGFQTSVDRIGADFNISYVENQPGRLFRNYRINSRNSRDWNYGWTTQGGRSQLGLNGQLLNYWGGNFTLTRNYASFDDRLTRGGPLARNLADWSLNFELGSDNRKKVNGRFRSGYGWGDSGGWNGNVGVSLSVRPAENWTISAGPAFRRTVTAAQYITTIDDPTAAHTFGRRYIFAPLDQTTVSMETRLNVNFTPELSLDMFAQPFVSSGDFSAPMQLRAPRMFAFDPYPALVEDRDFNTRSLRGNAVLRWEWQPGSTLFVVWQQRRAGELHCTVDSCRRGRFDFARDTRAVFDARPNNVFLVKMSYWLNI